MSKSRGLPQVAADPDKLRQVLTNLIDNAIKYSPDGGRVEVEIGRSGGRVRFRVADEGLGIPPAEQDRIFEKFFRLDPNLTRGVGGTGLGLYISRELVHADERPHLGRLRRPHAARRSSSSSRSPELLMRTRPVASYRPCPIRSCSASSKARLRPVLRGPRRNTSGGG